MKVMALLLALFLAAGITLAGQIDEQDINKKIMGTKASLNRLKLSLDSTETYLQKLDKRHKSAAQYLETTKGALDTLSTIVDSLNLWTTEAHLILDGFEENKSRAEQLRDQLAAKIVVAEVLFDSL